MSTLPQAPSPGPFLTDFDLYLFGQGNHHRIWSKLGAHVSTLDGVAGTHFAVWAPNAARVSVVGDFNQWDGRRHPMRLLGASDGLVVASCQVEPLSKDHSQVALLFQLPVAALRIALTFPESGAIRK